MNNFSQRIDELFWEEGIKREESLGQRHRGPREELVGEEEKSYKHTSHTVKVLS